MSTDLLDGALHFAVGIEDTFIPQTRPGHRALDEYELTGHYRHWRSDIDLAADSGAEAIRYGIPWYRVEPQPGVFTWSWLDPVIDHLLERGLTPIVDLMHYGVPLWLRDAAVNPDYAGRVADYAAAVATRYGDRLHLYTPLNEPNINAEWCGETGVWPPYRTGPDGWLAVAAGVARGIVTTQQAVASVLGSSATFVHVEAGLRYDLPTGPDATEEAVRSAAQRGQRDLLIEDLVCGLVDGDHPLAGYLAEHGITDAQLDWHRQHVAPPDVMGVNYYPHLSTGAVAGDVAGAAPARGAGGVQGLVAVLQRFATRYGAPVMITETSARDAGADQSRWLADSVRAVLELRAAGMAIAGYTWFPLFDLMDWSYRTGDREPAHYLEPLGLARLAPRPDGDLDRVPRTTFHRFRELALAHGARSPISEVLASE